MKKRWIILGTVSLMIAGCSGPTTQDYAHVTPPLDLREYLNGPLVAKGVLFDYSGKADLMFRVAMTGSWNGNEGKLDEHFTYSDGRTERRVWRIRYSDDHHFTATADDVIGTANGTQHGNSVNMRYTLDAKRPDGDRITLSMDDWMYLLDDQTLINRTAMRKYGVKVGELVITFEKGQGRE